MNIAASSKPALAGLILAVSMTTIDSTIVALSSPSIQQNLGLSHDGMQWAVNVYLLATAAFFLLGGRIADVVGHKRMALVGIAGFGLTSLLCGLAPAGDLAEAWLVGARALQGVSGAIMFPAAIGLVVEGFPRESRGRAMAIFFAITGAMTAIGPIAGGWLTQWTWRAIFWVNIPIAVVAFLIVALAAKPSVRRHERIDWLGALVVACGMGLVVFGLQQASPWGWDSPAVLASLAAGLLLLVAFVLLQRRSAQPLVRLAAFRDRGFTLSTLATLFASVAFISTFFFLSVYGQVSLQLSAAETGLLFLKFFLGFVVASRIGSVRFDRHGAKYVVLAGGIVGAIGFGWLALRVTDLTGDAHAFLNAQAWPIIVAGAGIGLMFSAVTTDAVNRSIGASYGEVSAVSQTMKNFGGALGMAVFTTVVTSRLTDLLTTSFARFGGTAADARSAVAQISGASGDSGGSLAQLPQAVRDQILQAVQTDCAGAVQWAFWGMAAAMAVVAVIGVLYPAGRTSLPETVSDVAGTSGTAVAPTATV
ncbi:MFS transporter [Leifsonia sp. F6_8S_P_1B]|uniref:MFS transporter n=1 Tax=Leifsonia williamsii TaxID=3035919 RepID=A0ABT8K7F4_9MICO|nr:MFS transporter [Leifsonia williamsii]MDN4613385.1 MFS transporter [Leifsonia williamsii]